eukprot:5005129-Pyramimonas_sp.AAC.1
MGFSGPRAGFPVGGPSWNCLGGFLGRLGRLLGRLGALLGVLLEAYLGPSGSYPGRPGPIGRRRWQAPKRGSRLNRNSC